MPQPAKVVNPFYALLLITGCAFAITATAYGVMSVRQLNRSRAAVSPANDRFTELMDKQGPQIMLLELLLLGIGTVGAIIVDRYRATDKSGSREYQVTTTPLRKPKFGGTDASATRTRSEQDEGHSSYGH